MHDVFLSYASEDKERVRPIVEAIEQEGVTVWWDENLPPGTSWRSFLQKTLDESRIVVVVWSQYSVESDFVIDEAEEGRKRNALIPILIEDVRAPLGLRGQQHIDLLDWQGEQDEAWQKLMRSIRTKLGKSAKKSVRREEKQSEVDWNKAQRTNTSAVYYEFLNLHWHSPHAKEALRLAQSLEKQEQEKRQQLTQSPQASFSASRLKLSPTSDYWTKRLETIQKADLAQPATAFGAMPAQQTEAESTEEFVFYQSPAFWVAFVVFPALGAAGAWLTDLLAGWASGWLAIGEFYSSTSTFWLYLMGIVWGAIYLIYGTIDASDFDEASFLIDAVRLPYDELFDFGNFGGLLTALPINLILSWGIALTLAFFFGTGFGIGAIIVITVIQVIIYFNLE